MCTSYNNDGTAKNNTLRALDDAIGDVVASDWCTSQCQTDCEGTKYEFNVDTQILNAEEICQEGSDTRNVSREMQ